MKHFCFILFCVCFCVFNTYGQGGVDYYNREGDAHVEKKEYGAAITMYSEALSIDCNFNSIEKLTNIWKDLPQWRIAAGLALKGCRECLIKLSTKNEKDINAIILLIDCYTEGIGGEKDPILAEEWKEKMASRLPLVDKIDNNKIDSIPQNLIVNNIDTTPRLNFFDKYHLFIAYTFSPTMPAGITIGGFGKYGVTASFRSTIIKPNSKYNCDNTKIQDINLDLYSYMFTDKDKWHSTMITSQFLFPVIKNKFFFSFGGGYGIRDYYVETELYDLKTAQEKGHEWCRNTQTSYRGLVAEVGTMYHYKKLVFLAGVNSIKFKNLDCYVSVGYSF